MPVRYVNRETQRFTARGTDGETYTVVEVSRYAEITPLSSDHVTEITYAGGSLTAYPGPRHVNLEDGVMTIAGTDIVLTRR